MRGCRFELVFIVSLIGCGLDRPDDVGYHVGGEVTGMWDNGAVTLRLEATGVDELLTVEANEPFEFDTLLDDGTSFTISVATAPTGHDCPVTGGAATVAGADYDAARVGCSGPEVDVTLSAPVDWTFDRDLLAQTVDLSLLMQEISVTVTAADATAIRVDDVEVTSGVASQVLPLVLGASEVAIEIAVGSASRTFNITFDRDARAVEQYVYGKASNTDNDDLFGYSLAFSGDTLVVGAAQEDSSTSTINGPENNENAADAGAAYVFRRVGATWQQEAYLKPNNPGAGDKFGHSVAIDGDTIVVGAPFEDGPGDSVTSSGAAYVFVRSGGLWAQQAYLRAASPSTTDGLGFSAAIDGDVVAMGAPGTDIGDTGFVIVFRRVGVNWSEEDRVAGSVGGTNAFGAGVALDGDLLAVGAPGLADDTAYAFRRSGSDWAEEQILRPTVDGDGDYFGQSIDVSGDTIVVGAWGESSSGRGINVPDTDEAGTFRGAAYVFRESGGVWSQEAFFKASNSDNIDQFGWSVSLEGDLVAIGARAESSASAGIDGDQSDNTAATAGAAYLFRREGSSWSQSTYIKASNPGTNDNFGHAVVLAGDGLVVAAHAEDSDATGLNGGQGDGPSTSSSGAVYLFR